VSYQMPLKMAGTHSGKAWTPTLGQVGSQTVSVRVIDTAGNFVGQDITLAVRGVNTAPRIASSPLTAAAVGTPYRSTVRAVDAEGDALSFSLNSAPDGMTVNPNTGEIAWTPGEMGQYPVEVQVTDARGADTTQRYTLVVGDGAANQFPAITSTPVPRANTGQAYSYTVAATDPNNDPLRYVLVSGPTGMKIDSRTGVLSWNPTAAQVGEYTVDVAAVDPYGAGAGQRFLLTALENPIPVVNSQPPAKAAVGIEYRYDIKAYDIHGDKVSYRLASGPEGMTFDEFGRLRWTPTEAGNYPVSLEIIDEFGAKAVQNFTLTAILDTEAPTVDLKYTLNFAKVGQEVTFAVQATDNLGAVTRSLTFDGNPVPLDRNGWYTHTFDAPGLYPLVATATDTAGNTSTETLNYQVSAANSQAPSVNLAAIDGPITAATTISGSVIDNDGDLQSYKLEIAPAGTEQWRTLAEGNGGVQGNLATLDPSSLPNDVYRLRLTGSDVEHTIWSEREVEIASELKLGNFTLSFTDLEIPLSGIPIQVIRRYDTLDVSQQDDFSYGWRLEFRDTNLRTNLPEDEVAKQFGIPTVGFREGQKVYLTEPGGKRVGFTFRCCWRNIA
jgi:Putative Ig domain